MNIYDYIEHEKKKILPDKKLEDYTQQYVGDIELLEEIINPDSNYVVQVFVDTDCDGQSSGLILREILDQFCIPYNIWVSRREDGYGLSNARLESLMSSLKLAIKKNESASGSSEYIIMDSHITNEYPKIVLITADLGITNIEEVDYAYKIGFDKVIITDHHTVGKEIPKADLIINPKLGDIESDWVCGAGVVYMAYRAYATQFMKIIAGIATVGDMVDIGYGSINRTLVKESIHILKTQVIENEKLRVFISTLIYGYKTNSRDISETEFGFTICPTINSLSRLGQPELLQDYFNCNQQYEKTIIERIKECNTKRKSIQKNGEKQAKNIIETMNITENRIYVIELPHEISSGVAGLVSSYILNNYNIDNVCVTKIGIGVSDGYKISGRAKHTNIYDLLKPISERVYGVSIGGHSHALGGSISDDDALALFKYEIGLLPTYAKVEDSNVYDIFYDDYDDATDKLLTFAPYGMGNKQPIICMEGYVSEVKKNKTKDIEHLFFTISIGEGWNVQEINIAKFKNYDGFHLDNMDYVRITGTINGKTIVTNTVEKKDPPIN